MGGARRKEDRSGLAHFFWLIFYVRPVYTELNGSLIHHPGFGRIGEEISGMVVRVKKKNDDYYYGVNKERVKTSQFVFLGLFARVCFRECSVFFSFLSELACTRCLYSGYPSPR